MPSRIFNERAVGHLVDPDGVETINVLGATIQFLTPPEDIARFLKVSEKYGYWNASPEENRRVGLPVT